MQCQISSSKIVSVPMSSPGEVSAVAAPFDSKAVDPAHIVAIMEQTEGGVCARLRRRGDGSPAVRGCKFRGRGCPTRSR